MPEGHSIHRLALAMEELFVGQSLRAFSPQGRFSLGARRIDGQILRKTWAHGKHLFLGFAPGIEVPAQLWVHVHLGLYGAWTFEGNEAFSAPHAIGAPRRRLGEGDEKALPALTHGTQWIPSEPRETVRLRLLGENGLADLTGPTRCDLITGAEKRTAISKLGPDPLRSEDKSDAFVAAVRRSKRAIGELLMDQKVLAGAGNIYRAEALYRAGVDPYLPGEKVRPTHLRGIWEDLQILMADGVDTGKIHTIDAEDIPADLDENIDPEGGRYYVYKRTGRPCHLCGKPISEAKMQGRNLFWCGYCQRRTPKRLRFGTR